MTNRLFPIRAPQMTLLLDQKICSEWMNNRFIIIIIILMKRVLDIWPTISQGKLWIINSFYSDHEPCFFQQIPSSKFHLHFCSWAVYFHTNCFSISEWFWKLRVTCIYLLPTANLKNSTKVGFLPWVPLELLKMPKSSKFHILWVVEAGQPQVISKFFLPSQPTPSQDAPVSQCDFRALSSFLANRLSQLTSELKASLVQESSVFKTRGV